MADDNKRLKATMEFDIYDAFMLWHAMCIAGNTARMSQRYKAEEKIRAYQQKFMDLVPPAAKHFDEEAFAEMGHYLQECDCYTVSIEYGERAWVKEGPIVVRIIKDQKGRTFRSFILDKFREDGPEIKAVRELLQQLSPMNVAEKEKENERENR